MQSALALAIATTVILFGSAYPVVKVALVDYDAGPLALLRFAVASLVCLAYVAIRRPLLPPKSDLPATALVGLLGVSIYHVLFNIGQRTVSASAASILVNTGPLWTALFAMWLLHERPTANLWVGLLVSIIGAALVAIGERGPLAFSFGAAFVLTAAVVQGASFVIQKPLVARSSPAGVIAVSIWFGTLVLAVVFGQAALAATSHATNGATLAAIYLGVGPGAARSCHVGARVGPATGLQGRPISPLRSTVCHGACSHWCSRNARRAHVRRRHAEHRGRRVESATPPQVTSRSHSLAHMNLQHQHRARGFTR